MWKKETAAINSIIYNRNFNENLTYKVELQDAHVERIRVGGCRKEA
jgi:hypothetical protein